MNRNASITTANTCTITSTERRRVRFDLTDDRSDENNKYDDVSRSTCNIYSNENERFDRQADEAIVLSKRILELSRQRRRNTRMILLEVAQNQGKKDMYYSNNGNDKLPRKASFPKVPVS